MRNVAQMKADHARRMNVTTEDDKYYKEPKPLTDEQKEHLLHTEEQIKKRFAERDRLESAWKEKYYSDKTDRELNNWHTKLCYPK